MSLPGRVTVRAPAKVNLALVVGPRRADGYHDIVSIFHAVSLYDELVARPGPEGSVLLDVHGDQADMVPLDESNLAIRAAHLLAEYAGVQAGVAFSITKHIPVAGGMAGGSADAAAALVACDALWGTALGREELGTLAGRLGADVPFALIGGTAVGTGRGDRLTPALARGTYHWVLALSDEGLSTGAVYAELDRLRNRTPVPPPTIPGKVMTALRSGDAAALGQVLRNDLERAVYALRPPLRLVVHAGRDLGALGAVVSGSGATCAFLARDEAHALDLAIGMTATGVCARVARATGPAPGARVIPQ
jgi:4-diphosphocytidyl-2-C-methyl-D-erythritol kinase